MGFDTCTTALLIVEETAVGAARTQSTQGSLVGFATLAGDGSSSVPRDTLPTVRPRNSPHTTAFTVCTHNLTPHVKHVQTTDRGVDHKRREFGDLIVWVQSCSACMLRPCMPGRQIQHATTSSTLEIAVQCRPQRRALQSSRPSQPCFHPRKLSSTRHLSPLSPSTS